MFRAKVLIVRRAKLYYTVSGTITSIGGRPVHRLREDWMEFHPVLSQSVHGTATYRFNDTRDCIIQFCPPDNEQMCSKHVEAWNKVIIKFRASSWWILINRSGRCLGTCYTFQIDLNLVTCNKDNGEINNALVEHTFCWLIFSEIN